jgi:hypothetical protein
MFTRTLSFCWSPVHVDDLAVEVGERPDGDLDRFAELEVGERARRSAPAVAVWRMRSTSGWESGTGFVPEPTNPVTPGVFFTTVQASSDMSMLTRT